MNSPIIVLLALELALRLYPITRWQLGVDTFYHLKVADQIRHEGRLPETVHGFLYNGTYAYPPLLHILLAVLKGRAARLVPLFCDLITAGLVFAATFSLSSRNLTLGLLSSTLYLAIPINYSDSLSLNPRSLGSMFFTVVMMCVLVLPESWLTLPFACIYGLLLLSHKLTAQVSWVVLGALALSLPEVGLRLMIGVVLGFGFAILVTKGFYRKVLREHLGYLRFHVRFGGFNRRKSFTHPLVLLRSNPFLILMPFIIFLDLSRGMSYTVLLLWVFATTGFAFLWRYGEGYRFASQASSGAAILVALSGENLLVAAICALVIVYCMWRQVASLRSLSPPFMVTQELIWCLDAIGRESAQRVLCLPMAYSYVCAYFTGKDVVGGDASLNGLKEGFRLSERIGTPGGLREIIEKDRVGLALVEYRTCSDFVGQLKNLGFEEIQSNSVYGVFRLSAFAVDPTSSRLLKTA
jgi:hypothetical protein